MTVILAVSGGVDSVAMLHSLAVQDSFAVAEKSKLIVAHFDHGIRKSSAADARFVAALAKHYGLAFELGSAQLGAQSNEADARNARWAFLKELQNKLNAPVATAHHSDDVFETQIINLLRGSGRRGMSVLKETKDITRPLINRTKAEIYDYVLQNKLEYVEDSTNADLRFLRNKVRNRYIPKLSNNVSRLQSLFAKVDGINVEIDSLLQDFVSSTFTISSTEVSVQKSFIQALDTVVLKELLREAIDRLQVVHDRQKITSTTITLLAEFAQRNTSNKSHDISKLLKAKLTKDQLIIYKTGQK